MAWIQRSSPVLPLSSWYFVSNSLKWFVQSLQTLPVVFVKQICAFIARSFICDISGEMVHNRLMLPFKGIESGSHAKQSENKKMLNQFTSGIRDPICAYLNTVSCATYLCCACNECEEYWIGPLRPPTRCTIHFHCWSMWIVSSRVDHMPVSDRHMLQCNWSRRRPMSHNALHTFRNLEFFRWTHFAGRHTIICLALHSTAVQSPRRKKLHPKLVFCASKTWFTNTTKVQWLTGQWALKGNEWKKTHLL